jgi:hypothetical protein
MPKINTLASGHVGPAPLPGGHSYLPFANAGQVAMVQAAMHIVDSKMKGYLPCNNAFKALPGGRTLAQIWLDPDVWINFDPTMVAGDYAATRAKEVTITAFTLSKGRWTVAASLVHELAHVGGAPGLASPLAEQILTPCLLGALQHPGLLGELRRSRLSRPA